MKFNYLIIVFSLFSFSVLGEIETSLTTELDGTSMTYEYSGGRSYQVKFDDSVVSYRYLSGSKPDKWWGPFPYKATITDKGEYFVSWYEEGYGDYITLLFDPKTNTLFGSGILGDKSTHFEKAEIINIKQ
jgi:phenolic acid decarboxylase